MNLDWETHTCLQRAGLLAEGPEGVAHPSVLGKQTHDTKHLMFQYHKALQTEQGAVNHLLLQEFLLNRSRIHFA